MLSEFNVTKFGKGPTPKLTCAGIVLPEYSTVPAVIERGIVKLRSLRLYTSM
jgi:hypothetical protein